MARTKGLHTTRAAVSVLHALCGSPHDVADALHALGVESKKPIREIRAHDLRYALSTLDSRRILPELPPTVGDVVSALLSIERRVSRTELADLSGVSTKASGIMLTCWPRYRCSISTTTAIG